jgi:hypothetical protein
MTVLSGSIDTSAIDLFRQGVELTSPEYFVSGIARIWAGFPNHIVPQNTFGQSVWFKEETPYIEISKFSTITYLTSSRGAKQSFETVTGYPMSAMHDGAIEPLLLRSSSIDGFPVPPHSVKGALMAGNTNEFKESSRIIDYIPYTTGSFPPFDYGTAKMRRLTYTSGSTPKPYRPSIVPYSDDFPYYPGGALPISASAAYNIARQALRPLDLNNRIPRNSRAATAGFVYDGAAFGTDSLAFGGLKF